MWHLCHPLPPPTHNKPAVLLLSHPAPLAPAALVPALMQHNCPQALPAPPPTPLSSLCPSPQAARADALARQLRTSENSRQQLNRLRTENEALKELLFELASDRRAAQNRLAELQTRVNEMVIRAPPEVSKGR